MKRNKELTPEFDEIIFSDRNKSYGAYDLRKRYKSALSLSVLCGIAICATLTVAMAFKPDKSTASTVKNIEVFELTDLLIPPAQPEVARKPPEQFSSLNNLKPEVTYDTSQISLYVPTADDISLTTLNGDPNDSVIIFVQPEDTFIPAENEPRFRVEEMPEFPGGLSALLRYVSENLKYPEEALENNIQGKVVLKFAVGVDGSPDRLEVLKGVDPLLDNEALRIVNTLPRFRPGKQNGVPVPVWFTLPVVFQIKQN